MIFPSCAWTVSRILLLFCLLAKGELVSRGDWYVKMKVVWLPWFGSLFSWGRADPQQAGCYKPLWTNLQGSSKAVWLSNLYGGFLFPLTLSLSFPPFFLIWYGRLHKWLTIPISSAYKIETYTRRLYLQGTFLAAWRGWLLYRAENKISSFAVDEVIIWNLWSYFFLVLFFPPRNAQRGVLLS